MPTSARFVVAPLVFVLGLALPSLWRRADAVAHAPEAHRTARPVVGRALVSHVDHADDATQPSAVAQQQTRRPSRNVRFVRRRTWPTARSDGDDRTSDPVVDDGAHDGADHDCARALRGANAVPHRIVVCANATNMSKPVRNQGVARSGGGVASAASVVCACHAQNDVVCQHLTAGAAWESVALFAAAGDALTVLPPPLPAASTTAAATAFAEEEEEDEEVEVRFIDVGVHVGSLSLPLWRHHGFRVLGFEAWRGNRDLVRYGRCLNRHRAVVVARRDTANGTSAVADAGSKSDDLPATQTATSATVTPDPALPPFRLHATALGKGECLLYSATDNVGDGQLACDAATVRARPPTIVSTEGRLMHRRTGRPVPMHALDSFAQKWAADDRDQEGLSVVDRAHAKGRVRRRVEYILKIDVEGHEGAVVEGAAWLLSDTGAPHARRPRFVFVEVWMHAPGRPLPTIDALLRHGYVGFPDPLSKGAAPRAAIRSVSDATRLIRRSDMGDRQQSLDFVFLHGGDAALLKWWGSRR